MKRPCSDDGNRPSWVPLAPETQLATENNQANEASEMKVLAINCGSSTLKFQVIEGTATDQTRGEQQRLAHGLVDRIGEHGEINFNSGTGRRLVQPTRVADHAEAMVSLLRWLQSIDLMGPDGIAALGHRVVHGGDHFTGPALIDDQALDAIDSLSHLAPLHNGPALSAIRAARQTLGRSMPMVATFDTAFHRTMPQRAACYAISQELAARHHIHRYGFHGLAHHYMAERYTAITSTPTQELKLITLQLGNGCSATAVEAGRSIDTSMGFTPLEGLIMGTRCGDVDPSLAGFLAQQEGVSIEQVEDWLNTRSGLLGVSGLSNDMRQLLAAEREGDSLAGLAIDMFCYRVRKYIGAYLAVLGGAQAVVFGGGIGENAAEARSRICAGMEWCGLTLDQERNNRAVGREGPISADGARVGAYVIPVDEESIIARDTIRCLEQSRRA